MKHALLTAAVPALVAGCHVPTDVPTTQTAGTQSAGTLLPAEQARDAFSGTWQIETAQPPGVTQDARKLVFRRDGTYAALGTADQELWAGTYDLDPATTPKIWDHRSIAAKAEGGDALGIYELDGDRLKVCCVVGKWQDRQWTGKPRPTEFTLPTADAVLELRRVKATE